MRGKDSQVTSQFHTARITPAYAGKSAGTADGKFKLQGSPPPMRGKEPYDVVAADLSRITPAYAGKSYYRCSCDHARQDHPRLCGEKVLAFRGTGTHLGSPPPMRGKAQTATTAGTKSGITPAYAGKSLAEEIGISEKEDHPRLCGEKAQPDTSYQRG